MKKKINIAVLVSGGGTNLQALIDAQGSVIKHGLITLVISNKVGAFALERANKAGIKTQTITIRDCANKQDFEQRLAETLEENAIDLIVLAGFLTILSPAFIARFANRIINVHPSLIPSFCGKGYYGLVVHEKALEYGVKVSGATVHFVNEVPDGGKIILQKAVYVEENDTPEVLQQRIMEQAEWVILPQAVEMVCKQLQER